MTSKMAFGAWSFAVMGASIFTFIWLVSIMHNVDKSWAMHSVDHSLVLAMDAKCNDNNINQLFDKTLTGVTGFQATDSHDIAGYAGARVKNASCVGDAIDAWQQKLADAVSSADKPRQVVHDIDNGYDIDNSDDRTDTFTFASLQDYENGANTSAITALVFTSIAMIVGVANFIMLLVSSKRYTMLESLFCFCAGFGSVIIVASPWISDVILMSAGAEFVALPVVVAFQITLLWVRPGATEDVESSDSFMF